MIPNPPFLQGSASSCRSSSVTVFLPVMAGMNLCLSTSSSRAMWSEMPGVVLMRYTYVYFAVSPCVSTAYAACGSVFATSERSNSSTHEDTFVATMSLRKESLPKAEPRYL